MALLDVYNTNREKVSQVEVSDAIFDAKVKEYLFYDVIRMQLANRRSGTSSTKQRGEVSGGRKKPWKQKGTGRARAGTSRSPVWRGGGITFGPRPRDYSFNLPKKVKKSALCSALTLKRRDEKLLVLDRIELQEVKTKTFKSMLDVLGTGCVLIIDEGNNNLTLSARNIPEVKVLPPDGLNLYDVLSHDAVFITQPCLEKIQRRLIP